MSAKDEPSGAGDWSFPPIEPAVPTAPTSPLGFGAALPAPPAQATAADRGDTSIAEPEPEPEAVAAPEPVYTPAPPPNLNVPHRNPVTAEPVSPMRALAGALVAVAGVLLGIGALLWATDPPTGDPALQSNPARSTRVPASAPPSVEPSTAPTVTQSAPTPAVAVPVPKLPLTVLNNSTRTGLADRAAARFRAAGWPIKLTGNFRGRVSDTTVYYEPGQLQSAQLLQRSFPGLTRVRPRFAGLPGSGLTVVLIGSYSA